jgi:hypothetical protein
MPSAYLAGQDLLTYGVPAATTQQVQQASTIIDGHLKRPEGLIWTPDSVGNPAYMAALSPSLTFTASGSISPGQNVVVPVAGPMLASDIVGEALVLDRATSGAVETVVVTAASGGQLTLASVRNNHSSGVLLEAGLTILEERALPAKRSVTRLSRNPIVRLVSGMGRYAYGRRSDQVSGLYNDTNLLAALQTFGGPPAWMSFDVSQANVSVQTSEVWVPAGLMLAYYSDVRIRYLAGFSASGLPSVIKQACANVIGKIMQFGPEADASFKAVGAGGSKLERFGATIMDNDTKLLLEPFEAKLLF